MEYENKKTEYDVNRGDGIQAATDRRFFSKAGVKPNDREVRLVKGVNMSRTQTDRSHNSKHKSKG